MYIAGHTLKNERYLLNMYFISDGNPFRPGSLTFGLKESPDSSEGPEMHAKLEEFAMLIRSLILIGAVRCNLMNIKELSDIQTILGFYLSSKDGSRCNKPLTIYSTEFNGLYLVMPLLQDSKFFDGRDTAVNFDIDTEITD
jgi:hypothetical protein